MGTLTQSWSSGAGLGMKSGLVAKVWSGNDTLTRSPVDSPPIEKKRLRRLNTTWLYKQRAPLASLDDSYINNVKNNDDTSSNSAQTLRTRSSSMPRSIIKSQSAGASRNRNVNSRKVTFRPKITVEYMDYEKHLKTEQEDLNSEPRDRQKFMVRNLTRISQQMQQRPSLVLNYDQTDSSSSLPSSSYYGSASSPPHMPATIDVNKHLQESHTSHDSTLPQVNIYFIPDKQHGTKMKMVVNIGAQFHPDEICVKANMSGNKVRVMASKIVENADGTQHVEPINERFLLPMEVDPYSVEARLDTKGHLTIEAPLLTNARRTAISQAQAGASISL